MSVLLWRVQVESQCREVASQSQMYHPWIRLCCPDERQQANHAELVRYHPRGNVCHPACSDTPQRVTNHWNGCLTVTRRLHHQGHWCNHFNSLKHQNRDFFLSIQHQIQGRAKLPHPSCVNRKRCLNGTGVIRLAEGSHHQATPGSLSSGCCSVLRQFCLRGTWARLRWTCSCLWSSSSTKKTNKKTHLLDAQHFLKYF